MPTKWKNGEIDGTTWHELLRSFIGVNELSICAALSEEVSRALQVNEVGLDPWLLPGLQEIVIEATGSLCSSFIRARQVAGRPLAVRSTLSGSRYRGEADDVEPSPHVLNSALAVSMSLLSEPVEVGAVIAANAGKRNKRFDPYACCSAAGSDVTTDSSSSPYPVVPTGFAGPNMAMLQHAHYAATYGLAPAYSYPLGPSLPAPPGMYPGAMFPTGPPLSSADQPAGPPGSPLPAQGSPQAMLPYHAYSLATAHYSPMQAQVQQAYYQFYPPPPAPGYPSYWSPYHPGATTSYPLSTQTGSPTSPVSASTVASGVEMQIKTGDESEDGLAT
ncbi:hypothetical protein EDB85DRAFT_2041685 [Lactarius pseudohatsudake]|nr:hypothetical protein EDB85DRAFT_2041685 [Lactarius pseudohatsudake]